jgi:hypothetical protein
LEAASFKVAGYIEMLSCTDVPSEYDIEEILDVLSVPEMKEMLKELPKVSILPSTPFLLCTSMQFAFYYPSVLPFRITVCSYVATMDSYTHYFRIYSSAFIYY